MKRTLIFVLGTALAVSGGILSGQTVPTIQFDSNPSPLTMPDNIHLGEVAGVATNSRGDIYVGEVVWSAGASRGAVSPDGHSLQKFTRQSAGSRR